MSGIANVMNIYKSKKRRYRGHLKIILLASLDRVGKWNVLFPEIGYRKTFMSEDQKTGGLRLPGKEEEVWVHKMVDS